MKETFLVIFFSLLLIGLSFSPTVYEAFQANNLGDPRRILLWGEHNFTYDYNVYLAKIRQGIEGRWTVIDKYTTEPHQGVLLQEFYLLAGKFGGVFNLTPRITYHLLRLILAIGYLLAIYCLICYFLKNSKQRKIAFLLALFSGSLPKFFYYQGSWHFAQWFDWWQEMDQVKRASYVPHYVFGHILMIVSLLFLLRSQNSLPLAARRYFLVAVFAGMVAGFVHPPSLLIIWGIYGLLTARKISLRAIFLFAVFVGITSLPLLYISRVTSIYPWKSIVDYDRLNPWLYSLKELILAYGVILPLGLLGAWLVVKNRQKDFLPLVFWVLVVPLGIVVFKLAGSHSELYFIQTAVHLPLAILTVYFLGLFFRWQGLLASLLLLISLPGIVGSVAGQFQFINERVAATLPLVPYPSQVMYPLRDWWEGIKWLEKNTSPRAIVLSEQTAGNYIPAYAGRTVYIGHVSETVDFKAKKALVDQFFSGIMSTEEAKEFLRQTKADFVFFDPQAKELGHFEAVRYPFLKPAYELQYVIIYQVVFND